MFAYHPFELLSSCRVKFFVFLTAAIPPGVEQGMEGSGIEGECIREMVDNSSGPGLVRDLLGSESQEMYNAAGPSTAHVRLHGWIGWPGRLANRH